MALLWRILGVTDGVDLPIGGYDCRAGALYLDLSCLQPASRR